METSNKINIEKIYIAAIGEFLNCCKETSSGAYDFVNKLIDKNYGSIKEYAKFLSINIDDRNILSINEKTLTKEEKQKIATYWIIGRYANTTEKKETIVLNRDGKKERLDFTGHVNEYHEIIKKIFAKKELVDDKGRKYNGNYFFHVEEVNSGKEEIDESFIVSMLVSLAVYAACTIASPYIAKKTPGLCSTIREFAENHPTITKIGSFLSPFDIDSFVEQDKINKGEISEDGEEDEIIDDTEGDDDFEAVTQDDFDDSSSINNTNGDGILPPGYEYVITNTYEYGHDYDENGNYIGNKKSE